MKGSIYICGLEDLLSLGCTSSQNWSADLRQSQWKFHQVAHGLGVGGKLWQLILKFTWKYKGSGIAKAILENKETFTTRYQSNKVTVFKTA